MHDPVTGDRDGTDPQREATDRPGDATASDGDWRATRLLGDRPRTDGSGSAAGITAVDPAARASSVSVYVRGMPGCRERERTVVETLETLAERGVLGEVSVRTWPEKVSLTGAGATHSGLVEEYQTFAEWAESHDASVRPPFVVRQVESSITDEHDEVLVTPALLVAVWDGDDLVTVYPHSHEGGVASVEDGLSVLLAGSDATVGDREDETERSSVPLVADSAAPTDGGDPEVTSDEN